MNQFAGDPRIAVPLVINAFTTHQDSQQWDATLSVCTDDFRIGKYGREWDIEQLRELWFTWAASGVVVRHLRTGLHFVTLSDEEVTTIGYGLFYVAKPTEDGVVPLLNHPVHFTEYHETFRNTENGWKMSYRLAIDIMQHEEKPLPGASVKAESVTA